VYESLSAQLAAALDLQERCRLYMERRPRLLPEAVELAKRATDPLVFVLPDDSTRRLLVRLANSKDPDKVQVGGRAPSSASGSGKAAGGRVYKEYNPEEDSEEEEVADEDDEYVMEIDHRPDRPLLKQKAAARPAKREREPGAKPPKAAGGAGDHNKTLKKARPGSPRAALPPCAAKGCTKEAQSSSSAYCGHRCATASAAELMQGLLLVRQGLCKSAQLSSAPATAPATAAAAASAGDAGAFVTQSSAAAASAALGDLTVVVSRALGRAAQPRPSNLADLDKLLTFCGKSPAQAPSKAEPKRIESMASTLPAAAQSALILTPSVMGEANADLRCKVRSLFENLLVASLSRSMQQSSAYSRGAILAQEIEEGLFDKHRTAPPAAGKAATVRPELDAAAAKAYGSHAQTLQRNFKRWNDYLVRLPSFSSSLPLFLSSRSSLAFSLFLLYFFSISPRP